MSRLHRFILMCLLALAIPIQGYAAASMAHCGGVSLDARAVIVHDASMDDLHDMSMSMSMSMDADTHGHAGVDVEARASTHKGACHAGAACCMAAAPSTAFAPSFGEAPADAVDPPTLRPRVAFLTGGPERPPRSDLA